jgi:hypothetical protein
VGVWFIAVCILPFIGTACIHKKVPDSRVAIIAPEASASMTAKKKSFDAQEAACQEAAILDIPIPLYTQRLPIITNDQHGSQVMLGYYSAIEPSSLITLYQEQMEQYGWHLARSFIGTESLLHFEKPTKACSVSIRPRNTLFNKTMGTDLVIYLEDSKFSW